MNGALPLPIERLLPHAGAMRLIDSVRHWDAESIECRARSHRNPDNPLRLEGRLPAPCALEYGAQAMAIHGALVAAQAAAPRVGLLVAAQEFEWRVQRLDIDATELEIGATRLLGSATQVAYTFEVRAAGSLLANGRASVILSVERWRTV